MEQARKRIVILSGIALLMVYFGLKLYHAPYETYTWTELLINYAAGFMRRGLIGKIAYWVSPYLSAKFFLVALLVVSYLVQLILYASLTREIGFSDWLMFTLSPAAFCFLFYDFSAYGRKDAFILLIFMICYWLIQKKFPLKLVFPLTLVLVQVGILIHEYTLFSFPFLLIVLLIAYRDQGNKTLWWMTGISLFFMIFNHAWLFALSKQYYNLDSIANSWVGLLPDYDLTPESGAFGWLGVPLKEGLQPVFDKLTYPQTFFSYLMGMVLASLPMVLLNMRYRIFAAMREKYENALGQLILLGFLLLSTLIIFIFSSDWGRLTYLYGFIIYLGLVVIKTSLACEDCGKPWASLTPYERFSFFVMFILFATTWQVKQYVDGGHIALQQGLLFQLFDWLAHIPLS